MPGPHGPSGDDFSRNNGQASPAHLRPARESYELVRHLGGDECLVDDVTRDFETAAVSPKLKALLAVAGKVQKGGKHVLPEDVARARAQGATDLEIHDTVLIAAAFCMYNRYVDGLATWTPHDRDSYRQRAAVVAREGYGSVLKQIEPLILGPS